MAKIGCFVRWQSEIPTWVDIVIVEVYWNSNCRASIWTTVDLGREQSIEGGLKPGGWEKNRKIGGHMKAAAVFSRGGAIYFLSKNDERAKQSGGGVTPKTPKPEAAAIQLGGLQGVTPCFLEDPFSEIIATATCDGGSRPHFLRCPILAPNIRRK